MQIIQWLKDWWFGATIGPRLKNMAEQMEQRTLTLKQATWRSLDRTQSYRVIEVGRAGSQQKVLAVIALGGDGQRYWIRCNRIDGVVPEEFCSKGAIIPKLPSA